MLTKEPEFLPRTSWGAEGMNGVLSETSPVPCKPVSALGCDPADQVRLNYFLLESSSFQPLKKLTIQTTKIQLSPSALRELACADCGTKMSGAQLSENQSHELQSVLYHLLAVQPWTSHFISLGLKRQYWHTACPITQDCFADQTRAEMWKHNSKQSRPSLVSVPVWPQQPQNPVGDSHAAPVSCLKSRFLPCDLIIYHANYIIFESGRETFLITLGKQV